MSRYLLIESRDPFDCRDSESFLELAGRIASYGDSVTLFLVQNAVFSVRRGGKFIPAIRDLIKRKVEIHADRFSLDERAIKERDRLEGVVVSELDRLVETLMQSGMKAIWH